MRQVAQGNAARLANAQSRQAIMCTFGHEAAMPSSCSFPRQDTMYSTCTSNDESLALTAPQPVLGILQTKWTCEGSESLPYLAFSPTVSSPRTDRIVAQSAIIHSIIFLAHCTTCAHAI